MNKTIGAPKEVIFCSKCVISNQRPSSTIEFKNIANKKKSFIEFDKDRVCSACYYNQTKSSDIDWNLREDKLIKLLEKFRRNDGNYDVLVPGSGGKDSAFTSHILKFKYGMNPLTVTWAPHLYTDIGWENMQNWSHLGGLDNLLFTPNGRLHRSMTKNAFHNLLHPFQPFIIGQRIIGPLMAKKFNIKLVFYGENQAEYGNAIDENKKPTMDINFFSTGNPKKMLFGGVSMEEYIKKQNFSFNDFKPYVPPTKKEILDYGVEVHYLGYYLKWDPQECYYYAVENTGFKPNNQRTEGTYSKYSSIDDKIDPFHYYTTLIKFGLGRCSYDASQEVRNDKITREEAVYLVNKYDQEFPKKYFKEFLSYIDTDENLFYKTIDSFRPSHLWIRDNEKWILKHSVS